MINKVRLAMGMVVMGVLVGCGGGGDGGGGTTINPGSYRIFKPTDFKQGSLSVSLPNLAASEQVLVIPVYASQKFDPDGFGYSLNVQGINSQTLNPQHRHADTAPDPHRQHHLEFLAESHRLMQNWYRLKQQGKLPAKVKAQAFNKCPAPYTLNQKQCNFFVSSGDNEVQITATLRFVSQNAYWFVQNQDVGDLSDQELSSLAQKFEQITVPTDTKYFGNFPDVDGNGKIFIVFSNLLGPAGLLGYVAPWDLLEDGQVSGRRSNEGDIFYATTPGSLGGDRATYFSTTMPATITHELKHLIASGVRILAGNAPEELWIEEGSAQAAQELANQGDNPDVSKFQLAEPHKFRLVYEGRPNDPKEGQGIYGYSFLFIWRVAERIGHDNFWKKWTAGPQRGIANLESKTAQPFADLMVDWAMTLALDHVQGADDFSYKAINLKDGSWQGLGLLQLATGQATARSMAYHLGQGLGSNAQISLQTNHPDPYLIVVRLGGG